MNSELLLSWLKIIAALPIVLLLAYISMKLSRSYMSNFKKGMFMKVIETIPVYHKSAVSIVQIGTKYFVLGVSEQGMQIITELTEKEMDEMKAQSKTQQHFNSNALSKLMTGLKDKKDWRQK
ncbi:MAG: flagellar biosynthetic protein FliO [Clostridiales bacterium]|nr:flagellar biosynthetic protein FliO [Clostridiales bacterium]